MDAFVDQPKVVLHDHLDPVISGLRTTDELRRVARVAVEDLAADGVVHAELRFAPLAHTSGDLAADAVMEAVLAGVDEASGPECTAAVIVCGPRDQEPEISVEAARLAARWAGRGVVGFDLAGAGLGDPASTHRDAFAVARDAGLGLTVGAGEMDEVASVADALDALGPCRLGHGWCLIDDCAVDDGRIVELGPIAARVRDAGIPLEMCLTSYTSLGLTIESHPAKMLFDAGLAMTLNPDDRTITSTSREHDLASRVLGFSSTELAALNERAAVAAFLPPDRRDRLARRVRSGWKPNPVRLVHLAETHQWRSTAGGAYLPLQFETEGFIHLSALHQVLTPANRFYRGRRDLTAVVLDATVLGDAVVWEAGTGTEEWFPHLYGAITPQAVVAEVDVVPGYDGGFLLPPELVAAGTV